MSKPKAKWSLHKRLMKPLASRTCLLMVVLAFLVAGCSSTKLAYRYADWGIVWWVEDYVSLTGD